ncbi:MAG TPA: hypothetical protein VFT41_04905 [Gemmatimonadaceae bacterium]|nr:hypothetical protein [Gemmatimonadaceae bacterium]
MARPTRAELEAENSELRGRLGSIYEELAEYFDDSDNVEPDDEEEDGEEEEE